jgi:hypothetical protein
MGIGASSEGSSLSVIFFPKKALAVFLLATFLLSVHIDVSEASNNIVYLR